MHWPLVLDVHGLHLDVSSDRSTTRSARGTNRRPAGVPAIRCDADHELRLASGTGTIGGFIKVERQDVNSVWTDITAEMLSYGFAAPNLPLTEPTGSAATGKLCNDPTPAAILRIQRLPDNARGLDGGELPVETAAANYAG